MLYESCASCSVLAVCIGFPVHVIIDQINMTMTTQWMKAMHRVAMSEYFH